MTKTRKKKQRIGKKTCVRDDVFCIFLPLQSERAKRLAALIEVELKHFQSNHFYIIRTYPAIICVWVLYNIKNKHKTKQTQNKTKQNKTKQK